jgi:hypothetical protein
LERAAGFLPRRRPCCRRPARRPVPCFRRRFRPSWDPRIRPRAPRQRPGAQPRIRRVRHQRHRAAVPPLRRSGQPPHQARRCALALPRRHHAAPLRHTVPPLRRQRRTRIRKHRYGVQHIAWLKGQATVSRPYMGRRSLRFPDPVTILSRAGESHLTIKWPVSDDCTFWYPEDLPRWPPTALVRLPGLTTLPTAASTRKRAPEGFAMPCARSK